MYLDIHAKFRGDRPLRGRDLKGGVKLTPPPPVKTCSQKALLRKGSSLFNCRENTDRAIMWLLDYAFFTSCDPIRKELTDAILQVRLDHNGSLSGIAMGTIISEASNYLSKSQKKKDRKVCTFLKFSCSLLPIRKY